MTTKKSRAIVQAEALQAFIVNGRRGTICLSTGTGKSKVSIDFMRENENVKTILITSPRTNLKESWRKELTKWGLHQDENDLNTWWLLGGRRFHITMENVQTAYKWKDRYFDFIIADEIHTMVTPEYSGVFGIKSLYIMGLTATHDIVDDNDKQEYYDKYCPIIYEYYDSAEDGIINKTRYFIVDHHLTNDDKVRVKIGKDIYNKGELQHYEYLTSQIKKGQQRMLAVGSNDWFRDAANWFWKGMDCSPEQKQAAIIYLNSIKYRKTFLQNLPSTTRLARTIKDGILDVNDTNKILVFSELTNQVDEITPFTVHSKNSKERNADLIEQFDNGEIRELGSCQSLTLGLNLKGATHAIMESYVGSSTRSKQKKGRLDRLATDDVANMWIIRVLDTQIEKWFESMMKNFSDYDKSEVHTITSKTITDGKFNYRSFEIG